MNKEPRLFKEIKRIKKSEKQQYFWIKKATNLEQTKRIQLRILNGLFKGLSTFEIIRGIEDDYLLLGEKATSRYWKQAIDMNLANAQSRGNWEKMEEIKDQGYQYARYTAIVDGRETNLCHGLNGKVMKLEEFKSNGLVPPLHYGCRSTLVQLNDKEVIDNDGNYRKHIKTASKEDIKGYQEKRQEGFGKIKKDETREIKDLVKEKELTVETNNNIIKTKIERDYQVYSEQLELELRQKSNEFITKRKETHRAEVDSLIGYTDNDYRLMNRALFANTVNEYHPNLKESIENLSSLIKSYRLDRDLIVHRGAELKFYDYQVGDVFAPRVFQSTSIYKGVSEQFVKEDTVTLTIRVPKEARAIYVGDTSVYPEEKELLLDKDIKMKVLKREGTHLELEVLLDD